MAAIPFPGEQIALKYRPFNITNVNYKHVGEVPIPASILVPKNLTPGKYPVFVRWHGGGFGAVRISSPVTVPSRMPFQLVQISHRCLTDLCYRALASSQTGTETGH